MGSKLAGFPNLGSEATEDRLTVFLSSGRQKVRRHARFHQRSLTAMSASKLPMCVPSPNEKTSQLGNIRNLAGTTNQAFR